uniref:ABC transporter substrate-binding protein n=1 Tax=Vaginimicrobium propionicum TaxID=1871034 RepID=UPI00097071EF|nr:sugar ABC transporter substrate-binding protein [Vaginimicrobium propionicum]
MPVNHKKRALALVAAAAVALSGALTGCSSAGNDSASSNVVEVWDYEGQGVSNEAMEAAVKSFEEENPDLKIKRTSFAFGDLSKSIIQGGVGGQIPDVAIIDNVDNQNFASLGLLKDITSEVSSMQDEYYEGPWSSTQLNGKTYGLPMNSNNLALFYNKTLFEQAGVATPPSTWDELAATAKKLATDGKMGLAISGVKNEQGTFQVLPFVWQAGGDIDEYAKYGGEALTFLKNMIDDGSMSSAVANYSQEDVRTQFTTGQTAMMVNGPWEISNLSDVDFEWGVAPLPKAQRAATGLGGENIVAFEGAKNPEGALKFVKWMASNKGVQTFCDISGQLSPRPDLDGKLKLSSDPNMQVFEKQMEFTHARSYGENYNKISEAVQLSIQEALTGAKSPTQAAQDAQATISGLLPEK